MIKTYMHMSFILSECIYFLAFMEGEKILLY